jgi:tetratricopeptide (TPR) repeat protein
MKDKQITMHNKRSLTGGCRLLVWIIPLLILTGGCGNFLAKSALHEANDLFGRGKFADSLNRYEQLMAKHPGAADRALFEMGFIYAHPGNKQKDYGKALECFEKIIREYPRSRLRQDSEMMVFHLHNMTDKDTKISAQNIQAARQMARIGELKRELEARKEEMAALQRKLELLKQKIAAPPEGPADKILIEKKERRMTLLADGQIVRTYRIALGEIPDGPKERQGDKKTPEGIYSIKGRNKNSRFYISLHISYPNEEDIRHAKKLGVSPGGNIMIHGLKNDFSWMGQTHTQRDWTEGCIAVTNEEIEEIEKLVPNGTIVEIRP